MDSEDLHVLTADVEEAVNRVQEVGQGILFHRVKFLTFSSIEKRHLQTEDLHEGRHLIREWWEISLLLTDPS